MGTGRCFLRSAVAAGLFLGVLGCEDRARPFSLGPGNGIGPLSLVTTPLELDTVHLGTTFPLDVHVEDEDGIDSIWVTLEPNVNTLQAFSGEGATSKSGGYTVLMPTTMVPPAETLFVMVQARDVLGDTGVVYVRRLLIQ
ncbi:MAG: hypothetical protein ABJB33_00685 [Gemmatimonadota bacterium]